MKFFSTIKGENVHISHKNKIIPKEEITVALSAAELLEKVKVEAEDYRKEVVKECEGLKEQASLAGFEEGLKKWNEQLKNLENEIAKVRSDMENSLVPLAMAAIKKIIGREIELKPETIVDIVATSLKAVSHHRKITIYVHKNDQDLLEAEKPKLKTLFEHLQSLTVATRDDLNPGECIIETEAGIINASWENQLKALESAFHAIVHANGRKQT